MAESPPCPACPWSRGGYCTAPSLRWFLVPGLPPSPRFASRGGFTSEAAALARRKEVEDRAAKEAKLGSLRANLC